MKNVYYKYLIVLFAVFCLSGKGYSQGSEFGIVLSGMEWGSGTGTVNSSYYLPTQAEFNYYSGLGFKVFRIPFLWERMQPTLGGALNATYLGYLDQVIGYATTAGVNVFIDCHNYARYPADPSTSSSSTVITQGGPTQAQFNNLWTQLATHYASNTTVWGYDIMNEPHDLGAANWPAIVQSVVTAIRTVDTQHTIIIEGDHWSQGHLWPTLPNSTGLAATTDPSNNLLFEAHQYFDSDESGTYASTSFAGNTPLGSANTVTSGVTLITPFVNWINTNKLRGMVGEYGIPNNASASDQTSWNSLLGNFLSYLQTNCILGTYWAGGPGWPNSYVTSSEPLNDNYTTASDERPQMPTLATYTSFLSSCTPVGSGGAPSPVTVSITSPSTAATLVVGNNITITASASTTSGTISQVEFYEGGTPIGTTTTSPYSVTWAPSAPGTYAITAIATASGAQTATSSAVTITVLEPVYETTTAPVIDGVAEATWNNFPAVALNNVTIGTVSSSTYLSANWKATWDANNLYVLVTVTDDLLVNDNQAALYNDDGIEIYFDLGNTKTATYGNNQFQYVFRWNDTKIYENIHNATTGVKMGQTNQGITAGCANNCAAQGYTIEVSIPWTTLTATAAPAIGSLEGFDVAVNDDDTGTRNAKIAWNMTSDDDYNDPANFGTVIMEGVNCTAPPATITAAGNTTFCTGGSVQLNANTGTGLTYQWSNSGTAISGATNASYTATATGSYTVSVKNSTGCTATSSATTVTLIGPPTPVITAAGPTTFNAGGSVVLNANTGTGITYQWSNSGTAISGATQVSYTATTAGTYTVSEIGLACASATSSGVVVTVRNVSVTITSPTTNTTTSGNVTLTATATANGSTITQVAFYANGTLVGTATTSPYTITWTNPVGGSYHIIAIATDAKAEVDTSAAITLSIIPPVFNTATAPTIDGNVDPLWNNYQAYALNNVIIGTVSSPTYLSANWKATWDANNFYVLVTVQDDVLVNNNQGSSTFYNDDGIEIYFDFGNTKTTSYAANQFQYAFRWNDTSVYEFQRGATKGVKMKQTSQGITPGCTNNCAAVGYTIEVSIPWTTLTATKAPAIGSLEGFDVAVNDDDTGVRNAKIAWNMTTDADYQDPADFGTVIMEGAPCTLPTAAITPATTATYCTGSSVTLAGNTGTGFTYQWYEGVTPISGATSQTYAASAAASYILAVKNNTGCTGTSLPTAVTATALPAATITPVTTTTFCAGASVVLNANTGTGLTYQWDNSGVAINGATLASYTATATGSYTVTVKNSNNCSATSAPAAVTVYPLPTAAITPATTASFCTGGSVLLSANTGTELTYQWYSGGTPITGATSANYTATTAATYTVTVTNTNNCSATSTGTAVTINALPTATITPATTTTFCLGGSVVLNANTGTGLTYQWNLGGTAISGATNSALTASSPGLYTVVVTNANNCSATSTGVTVIVNELPIAMITPATSTTFCTGGSATLNANTGTGLTYQWTNGGTIISGATLANYTANTSGGYTVIVKNSFNCSTTSAPTTVTVNSLPAATITPPTSASFCTGGSVVLNANTGAGLTYQWNVGGTAIGGATSASYAASAIGTYTVAVINANNCSYTSPTTTVTANPLPTATITAATSTTFCPGGSVVLNANTGAGLIYQWSNSGTTISGATLASYTASTSGTYTVAVTNSNNCSTTSTGTTVTVEALPTAIITPASSTTLCTGGTVVLNANAGTGLTYQWSDGGVAISGATTSAYTANATGSYTVTVTNANNCTATSTGTGVTVNSSPTATITPTTTTTFCSGGSVVLNANSGTGLTYQWSNGANPISGATASSYTATATGSYTVSVSFANNCSATSTGTNVVVNAIPAPPTITSPVTYCQGTTATALTATGSSLLWYSLPSTGAGSSAAPVPSTTSAGASGYYVSQTVNSCESPRATIIVNINSQPTAIITPASATALCTGGSVVLNANTGTGLTYQWSNGGTPISGATSSIYTASVAGAYTVTEINTNNCSAASPGTTVTVSALPTATITPASATTFCAGSSVVLNANSGTGLTYQWSNGGTIISGATSASYIATTAGLYSVTVVNANNCSATSSGTTITVNPVPVAPIVASPVTYCQSASATALTATGTSLLWYTAPSGGGTGSPTAPIPVTSTAGTSNYYVSQTVNTCESPRATISVIINAQPPATITPATSTMLCSGGSVVLNANTGAGITYQWSNNGTIINGATTSSYTTGSAGTYTVAETNVNNCSAISPVTTVTVNALPAALVTPASTTTFCSGGSVALNANSGTGLTYQWNNGGIAITGATASGYTAITGGSYAVTVTNANNCSATSTPTAVTVNALPVSTIMAATATTICAGSSVVLNANTDTGINFQWNNGGIAITGATVSSYTASAGGSYTVTITNSNLCSTTSSGTIVTVDTPPTTANAGTAQHITSANTVLAANAPSSGTGNWSVISGTGTFANSSSPTTSVTGLSAGANVFEWTITSGPCGSSVSTVTISVGIAPVVQTISGLSKVISNQKGVTYAVTSNAGSTYHWSLPPGAAITSANSDSSQITINFGSSGGNISVTETNAYGSAISSLAVTVGNTPTPEPISGPLAVVYGATGITYSVSPISGYTYHWNLPTGVIITSASSDSNQVTVSFGNSGGTVAVEETNTYGNATSSIQVAVGAAPPKQTISGPTIVLAGTTGVTYAVTPSSGSTFKWTLPPGAVIASISADSSQITINFGSTGGNVSVTQTNSFGSATSSLPVNVGTAPVPQNISGLKFVTPNETGVTYSVTSVAGVKNQWILPPGAVITSANSDSSQITVSYGTSGGSISINQTNSFGSTTSSLAISVGNAPPPQTITGPVSVASGTTGVAYSIAPGTGVNTSWILPPGATISATNSDTTEIVVSFGSIGGNISVTQTNAYGSTISSLAVKVGNIPPQQIITGLSSVTPGDSGITYSVASHAGSTYQWSLPPGAKITSANGDSSEITVTFGTTSGNVSVTETNSFGSTTNILPVTIGQATAVIAAKAGDSYEVYPNPFPEKTTIVVTSVNNDKVTLTIMNVQGITCYTSSDYYTNQQIVIGDQLASGGIYFVQLSYGDVVKVIKVIKVD